MSPISTPRPDRVTRHTPAGKPSGPHLMRTCRGTLIALSLLVGCTVSGPETPSGSGRRLARLVRVADGDSFEARIGADRVTIRLWGIDCPERGQDFSNVARNRTRALLQRGAFEIEMRDRDSYGRLVCIVHLADGKRLNQLLVSDGLAWWYRRYAPGDRELEALEADAREARRGLWSLKAPTPPWKHRAKRR